MAPPQPASTRGRDDWGCVVIKHSLYLAALAADDAFAAELARAYGRRAVDMRYGPAEALTPEVRAALDAKLAADAALWGASCAIPRVLAPAQPRELARALRRYVRPR